MTIEIQPPVYEHLRITIPACEALERSGNVVTQTGSNSIGTPEYSVTLTHPPAGLVLCLIGTRSDQHRGLRLEIEPEFPGEWRDGNGIAWHERGEWVPCPECGAALVWYEAGYVPGYRICTNGHHSQLSSDGRSAKLTGGSGIDMY
jgi:hypothetical protein